MDVNIQEVINLGIGGFALWLMYMIHTKTVDNQGKLAESIDKNTEATKELYDYVKVRNGTLERLVQADPKIKRAAKNALNSKK